MTLVLKAFQVVLLIDRLPVAYRLRAIVQRAAVMRHLVPA